MSGPLQCPLSQTQTGLAEYSTHAYALIRPEKSTLLLLRVSWSGALVSWPRFLWSTRPVHVKIAILAMLYGDANIHSVRSSFYGLLVATIFKQFVYSPVSAEYVTRASQVCIILIATSSRHTLFLPKWKTEKLFGVADPVLSVPCCSLEHRVKESSGEMVDCGCVHLDKASVVAKCNYWRIRMRPIVSGRSCYMLRTNWHSLH